MAGAWFADDLLRKYPQHAKAFMKHNEGEHLIQRFLTWATDHDCCFSASGAPYTAEELSKMIGSFFEIDKVELKAEKDRIAGEISEHETQVFKLNQLEMYGKKSNG